jgi:hypothetical protein
VWGCGRWALVVALGGCTQSNPAFTGARGSGGDGPGDSLRDAGSGGAGATPDDARVVPIPPADGPAPAEVSRADGPGSTGLILHWRFDESTGTVAMDSSGSGVHGTYLGEPTLPQPAAAVPPTAFSNPASREFPATGRPSVRAVGAREALQLQPSDQITMSVWYRATAASAAYGGDLINLADAAFIRLKPNHIETGRRRDLAVSPTYALAEDDQLANALDGRWHHVAGVITADSVRLYFDGAFRTAVPETRPTQFPGNDVIVGRRDLLTADQQFQGTIDDVRVYRRALSDQEISALARGTP